jgi:hypothetical protein
VASVAFATTYVRVEKDGTKTYSDRPLPGGQPVDIEPAQTYSAPPAPVHSDSNLTAEQRLLRQMDNFSYTSCAITPENDATFTNPESVPIGAQTNPELRPGDSVTLTVDGRATGSNSSSYLLQPADRGTHSVQLTIKDRFGRVLCSASSSFHVIRPTLNSPARRRPTPH